MEPKEVPSLLSVERWEVKSSRLGNSELRVQIELR